MNVSRLLVMTAVDGGDVYGVGLIVCVADLIFGYRSIIILFIHLVYAINCNDWWNVTRIYLISNETHKNGSP